MLICAVHAASLLRPPTRTCDVSSSTVARPSVIVLRRHRAVHLLDDGAAIAKEATSDVSAAESSPTSVDGELEKFFFDRAEVYVRSGAGGLGAIGFCGTRPAGGTGGAGGSVYLECSDDYNTLSHLQGRIGPDADRPAS